MSKSTQQISPEVTLKRYYEAMNAGKADIAFALFAAEAIRKERFISAPEQGQTGHGYGRCKTLR